MSLLLDDLMLNWCAGGFDDEGFPEELEIKNTETGETIRYIREDKNEDSETTL
jgi:hypothetical protein